MYSRAVISTIYNSRSLNKQSAQRRRRGGKQFLELKKPIFKSALRSLRVVGGGGTDHFLESKQTVCKDVSRGTGFVLEIEI
jgi:hypothetical protein